MLQKPRLVREVVGQRTLPRRRRRLFHPLAHLPLALLQVLHHDAVAPKVRAGQVHDEAAEVRALHADDQQHLASLGVQPARADERGRPVRSLAAEAEELRDAPRRRPSGSLAVRSPRAVALAEEDARAHAPAREFLDPPLELAHEVFVPAHVRREHDVLQQPEEFRASAPSFGDARRDAVGGVRDGLRQDLRVVVLQRALRVQLVQRVATVLQVRVVNAEVPRVVPQRRDVEREDLELGERAVAALDDLPGQAVRRREHLLAVERAVVGHRAVAGVHVREEPARQPVFDAEVRQQPGLVEDREARLDELELVAVVSVVGVVTVLVVDAWGTGEVPRVVRVLHRGRGHSIRRAERGLEVSVG